MPPEQQTPNVSYAPQPAGQSNGERKKLLLIFITTVVLFVAIIALLLMGGSKKIVVNVKSDRTSEITYRFVNQANQNDLIEVKDISKSVEVALSEGTYELTVQQDETNFFSVVNTGENTVVEAAPKPERGRRYVGNLPRDCRNFIANRLYSYECGGTLGSMLTHMPATATQPTYTQPSSTLTEDVIEGLIKTKEGDVLLVYEAAVAGHERFSKRSNEESPHIAFVPKDGLGTNLGTRTPLKGLPENERYSVQPYREGFLAYSESLTQAFYYSSTKATPAKQTIATPEDKDLVPDILTAKDSLFAVAYVREESQNPESDSIIIVHENNQPRTYEMDKTFESIRLCGDKKLCALSKGTMEVYDVSDKEIRILYSVMNARNFDAYDGKLVISRDSEVISLDVDRRAGQIQYTYGSFAPCGIQSAGSSYLVCIEADQGAKSILYVEQEQVSDDIDKKIVSLLDMSEVSVASIYGSFIAITPRAGGVEYQPDTDTFGYNPEKITASKKIIEEKLDQIGLDRKKYKIHYTIN